MKFIIPKMKCETVNRMYNMFHRTRAAIKKDIQTVAWAEIKSTKHHRFDKCRIIVTAHFIGPRKHDPDNLYVKPFIDALVQAGVLKDDNNTVVESVTLKVVSEAKSNFVEIELL